MTLHYACCGIAILAFLVTKTSFAFGHMLEEVVIMTPLYQTE